MSNAFGCWTRIWSKENRVINRQKTPRICWSSPTQLLVWRLLVYLAESGRGAKFSSTYGHILKEEVRRSKLRRGGTAWRASVEILRGKGTLVKGAYG